MTPCLTSGNLTPVLCNFLLHPAISERRVCCFLPPPNLSDGLVCCFLLHPNLSDGSVCHFLWHKKKPKGERFGVSKLFPLWQPRYPAPSGPEALRPIVADSLPFSVGNLPNCQFFTLHNKYTTFFSTFQGREEKCSISLSRRSRKWKSCPPAPARSA